MSNNYEAIALATSKEVLDDNNDFMLKVLTEANRWQESETELAQGRSNFQIEKFIVHDNFTIPSAFKAAIINTSKRNKVEEIIRFYCVQKSV